MYKQIAAMIRISGYEATNNERILAEVFAENEGHHSLSGLKALFKEATGHNISIREIKRFMNFMCEYGAAEKKDFPEGAHYEHRHIGEHHDHLICSKCGQVVEFEREALEELQSKIAKSFGFRLYRHVMDLFGICGACQQSNQVDLGIEKLPEGESIVVSRINGGRKTISHLANLGISEGAQVKLVRKTPPPLVSVGESKFAIGNELTDKIYGNLKKGVA